MLAMIKTILGLSDTSKDNLLQILISQAQDEAVNYTHNTDCLPYIQSTIIQMVVYAYNRIGTEGVGAEGYSGVSFTYLEDYPSSIMRALNAFRKVRVV